MSIGKGSFNMRAKRWVIASPDTERVRVLSRETGYRPLTAAVLSARGIDTPQAAADYLSCDVRGLSLHLSRISVSIWTA